MDTLKTIFSRKSVRSYTGAPVPENVLKVILKAAYAAPVGMARYENIHITVVENQGLLAEIDSNAAEFFGKPGVHPLYGAPVLIIVSTKLAGTSADHVPSADVGMIIHNMALTATDMGAGSCCIYGAIAGLNGNASLKEKLGLPEGFTAAGALAVGETAETFEEREIPADRIATVYLK